VELSLVVAVVVADVDTDDTTVLVTVEVAELETVVVTVLTLVAVTVVVAVVVTVLVPVLESVDVAVVVTVEKWHVPKSPALCSSTITFKSDTSASQSSLVREASRLLLEPVVQKSEPNCAVFPPFLRNSRIIRLMLVAVSVHVAPPVSKLSKNAGSVPSSWNSRSSTNEPSKSPFLWHEAKTASSAFD
jgi:hypothetical protein